MPELLLHSCVGIKQGQCTYLNFFLSSCAHTRYGINPEPATRRAAGQYQVAISNTLASVSFPGGLRRYCSCCSRSTLYGDSCTASSLPPPAPPPPAAIALVRAGCLRRQFGQPRANSHPLSHSSYTSARAHSAHPPQSVWSRSTVVYWLSSSSAIT